MFMTSEKLTSESDAEQYLCAITGVPKEDCLLFDIETTGLSASSSFVFLIGCVFYDRNEACFVLRQYLIRYVQEEEELLRAFFSLAEQYKILLHFNGQTFDLPFLAKRAQALGLFDPLPDLQSIDLYQRFRPLKQLLGLSHMNQKSLEQFLQWPRRDSLDGAQVVSGYWDFSVSGKPDTSQPLLLHNHDDLLGLMQVTALESFKALADGRTGSLPGEKEPESTDLKSAGSRCAASESFDHRFLILHFQTTLPLPLADAWIRRKDAPPDGEYLLTVRGSEAELCIPIFTGELLYFLPDYKNYYFLPLENQAIHKSLAAYVSRDCRIPARPQTCFVPRKGRFLPQPGAYFSPSFRKDYDSKEYYFEYTGEHPDKINEKKWADYAALIVRYLCSG